jgi:catechol 2,3-dioxygenase-like lactoylglutathione lyase family enzyme
MPGSEAADAITITGIDHVVINVSDLARSVQWYARVLGAEPHQVDPGHGRAIRTSLRIGPQKINLRPVATDTTDWFTAGHAAAGSDDLCFLTSAAPEAVVAHLQACGVPIVEGPVNRQGARGTLRSVYCRDPDGSLIEIASYEV